MKNSNFISPISIRDIDINKIVVSNKFPLGKEDFKYFVGYKKPGKNRPLCIIHPPKVIYKKMVMKIDVYLFFNKRRKISIKSVEMLEKDSKNIKKKLIVTLYIVKNI